MRDELPNQIYLQYYDENGEDLLNPARNEVTWCIDRINESDVVYTLATLELTALLERLARCAEHIVYEYDDMSTRAEREPIARDMRIARILAARIREALAQEVNDD